MYLTFIVVAFIVNVPLFGNWNHTPYWFIRIGWQGIAIEWLIFYKRSKVGPKWQNVQLISKCSSDKAGCWTVQKNLVGILSQLAEQKLRLIKGADTIAIDDVTGSRMWWTVVKTLHPGLLLVATLTATFKPQKRFHIVRLTLLWDKLLPIQRNYSESPMTICRCGWKTLISVVHPCLPCR